MAAGRPVIVSDIDGIREVVEGPASCLKMGMKRFGGKDTLFNRASRSI